MTAEARLSAALSRHDRLAIAVSGGVDSLTLASFAQGCLPGRVEMIHAVSPAVPAEATQRVRDLARRQGWRLSLVEPRELDDPDYRANPVNRCYFCKSRLYDRLREVTAATLASGANLDDLGDYRPGLLAASERQVVHPYVEAEIDKEAVRGLARRMELGDVAELPAAPCLASRIETGIAISPEDLAFIGEMERGLTAATGRAVLRCRITGKGVIVETDHPHAEALRPVAEALCREAGRPFGGIRPYRRGSMFVHDRG